MSTYFEEMHKQINPQYTAKALKIVNIPDSIVYLTAREALKAVMADAGYSNDDVLLPCVHCIMSDTWSHGHMTYQAPFTPREYLDFRKIKVPEYGKPSYYSIDFAEGGHAFIYELDCGGFTFFYDVDSDNYEVNQGVDVIDFWGAYEIGRPSIYSAIRYHEHSYHMSRFF